MPNKTVLDLIQAVSALSDVVGILHNDVKWIKRILWAVLGVGTATLSGMVPFILGHIQWH